MTWPEASKAASENGSTLVWPFGACEQHGPHLPLITDTFFAENILIKTLESLPKKNAHMDDAISINWFLS